MNNWQFFWDKLPLLLQKIGEQIYLTASAIVIAVLISVPLGIFIARKRKFANYVLITASIMQTLPSLAVLGFFIPIFGIGVKTAIVALVIYTVLPIIRNTVTGIRNIAPDLLEAAEGLGLTKTQTMRQIELPLALPFIVAGIRTATAMGVGIATIAAFIGAGGLGDFIYEGLSLNNTRLILLGAIPAAVLALVLDFLIGRVEASFVIPRKHHRRFGCWGLSLIMLVFFMLALVFLVTHSNRNNQIVIGTKNFTEQFILGELMSQLISAKTNLKVVKKFNLGGTFVCHNALVNGQIDLYPEYTGTAYTVILGQSGLTNGMAIFDFVKYAYQSQLNITWLPAFGFNNSNALALRNSLVQQYQIKTISDLNKMTLKLTIGVPPDFMERPDGFLGLKQTYHLEFAKVRLMDPGLIYQAIKNNQIDLVLAYSTDARIMEYNLSVLEDDRHLFPPYYAAPVIRSQVLNKYPEIQAALLMLSHKIDDQMMQKLNYQVDVLKRSPEQVAHEFILKNI